MTEPDLPVRQRFSLSNRVALLAAICVAGVVALVSLGGYLTVRTSLYGQAADDLLARARTVAGVLPQPSDSGVELLNVSGLSFSDIRFDIVSADGARHTYLNEAMRLPGQFLGPQERAVAAGTRAESAREVNGWEVVAVPFHQTGYPWALVAGRPLNQERGTLRRLNVVLFLVGGAGILIAALAGTAVARGGLRPVQRLTGATERVARTGDLRPIPVTGDDELARLTHSFNMMLGALSASREQQRQLVADAGHELRTPLTSMRTNLELLLAAQRSDAPQLSDEDRAEINADVHAQLDELTQLIGDLTELAREDVPEMANEQLELTEVVDAATERARRRRNDVTFVLDLHPWTLFGDRHALERAVLNLLDNAGKFSPAGGVVRVGLHPAGDGTALLRVADSGPGIAAEDRAKVFDRFYRSSEARTLPGSGLGLAIVQQVVLRHGGTVHADVAPGGGALLTLRLPGEPGETGTPEP